MQAIITLRTLFRGITLAFCLVLLYAFWLPLVIVFKGGFLLVTLAVRETCHLYHMTKSSFFDFRKNEPRSLIKK